MCHCGESQTIVSQRSQMQKIDWTFSLPEVQEQAKLISVNIITAVVIWVGEGLGTGKKWKSKRALSRVMQILYILTEVVIT